MHRERGTHTYIYIYMYIYLSVYLSIYLSISLSIHIYIYIYTHMSYMHMFISSTTPAPRGAGRESFATSWGLLGPLYLGPPSL